MTWAPTAVLDCWRENLMHLRWDEMILGWLLEELSSQEVHHTTSVVNFIPDKFNLRWEIVQFSCSFVSDSLWPHGPAHQASQSITNSWSLLKLMSIDLVMPSNHLTLCYPFLLLPSIFPSIKVFSNESILHIRWSKFWTSPSNEYSGL